jgi:hypothetical protein
VSPTSTSLVIFCTKWGVPNKGDESRTCIDELQVFLPVHLEFLDFIILFQWKMPYYNLKSVIQTTSIKIMRLKDVGLGYGRQLYFHCLLKYMVICAFENSPSIPSFLATQIVYIGYGSFKKNDPFSFYPSIAMILVFLYLIAANNNVLVLCLCPQNIIEISLSRKNCHRP